MGAVLLATAAWGAPSAHAAVNVSLEWQPCGTATECAWLEVPLDYGDPYTPTVQLAVRRAPATGLDEPIGTLVTIAGGPGQRGTDWVVPGLHTAAIHEHFDIVSWDPRGTSGETLVDCIPTWDPYVGLDRSPDDPEERAALDERTSELAAGCLSTHGEFLPYLGTIEAAQDLERLRQALHEDEIDILASSYGSEIALTYATLYPQRVRAIVLDGYSDPNLDPDQLQVEQAGAFERQLDGLLAACADDLSCPFHQDGRPGVALDTLLAELDARALPTDDPDHPLTQSDAYEAIVGSLVRGPAAQQRLLSGLGGAVAGDGRPLLSIAAEIRGEYEAGGLTMGAFAAIECADDGPYWEERTGAEVEELTARVHEAAPRLGAWLWSPPADADLPPLGLCAMSPYYVLDDQGPIDAAGAGPVLVLTTSGDPTTPATAAERALDDLEDAAVLTLDADHHLAYHVALGRPDEPRYACVLDAVERYLIELEAPTVQTVCPA